MSIEFQCRYCSKTLRVADQSAGKKCKCPSCSATLDIPVFEPASLAPVDAPPSADTSDSDVLQIGCPKCRVVLHYVSALEGTRGMCKGCGHIFTLSQKAIDAPTTDSFPFECPACHFMFEGKPGMEGKKGKCTECNEVFFIAPLKLPEPKPAVSPVQVSKPRPTPTPAPANPKSRQTAAPKPSTPKSNGPKSPVRPSATTPPVTPSVPSPSIWDDLAIPDANWNAPAQATQNPYTASYPTGGGYRAPSKRKRSLDQDTVYSIAYWHRALVTSFLWSLVVGILYGILVVVAQLVLVKGQVDMTLLIAIGVPFAILVLSLLFLAIRFLIAYIFLCIRLYDGPVAALFILGYFLGCIPFLPLILLIIVLIKAHSVLKGAGYDVGLTGVDPNSL
ncbi:zinc ribbon domain-containing protein [Pirellula sp. SH-Sr6A]|uniref:zinc ribbon domain-containing protein n=1 Tax=Pirellula sp. SH-Sr6A TaxID=1632865 RepID=UPI0011BAAB60|nr:zinc ribbon domain-containing protein [Pirellula sp. SH-Sr6A]